MIINRTIMYDDVFLFNGSTVQGTLQKRLKKRSRASHTFLTALQWLYYYSMIATLL